MTCYVSSGTLNSTNSTQLSGRRRRRDSDKRREVEGKYILWGVQRFWGRMPFLSPTSAKDIRWTSSFLFFYHQQTADGRDIASFYVCSKTSVARNLVKTLWNIYCVEQKSSRIVQWVRKVTGHISIQMILVIPLCACKVTLELDNETVDTDVYCGNNVAW